MTTQNYDLMSLICDEVARQLGIDPDIDSPDFEKLYDDISQPILALLDARDEIGFLLKNGICSI